MKRVSVVLAALAFIFALNTVAMAATQSVTAQATLAGQCKFTGVSNINFGALNVDTAADVTATGSVTFWCTKSSTWNITSIASPNDAGGNHYLVDTVSASNKIKYAVSAASSTGAGTGKTSPLTVNLNGTILGTDYQDAAATTGSYQDTLTVTLTP